MNNVTLFARLKWEMQVLGEFRIMWWHNSICVCVCVLQTLCDMFINSCCLGPCYPVSMSLILGGRGGGVLAQNGHTPPTRPEKYLGLLVSSSTCHWLEVGWVGGRELCSINDAFQTTFYCFFTTDPDDRIQSLLSPQGRGDFGAASPLGAPWAGTGLGF